MNDQQIESMQNNIQYSVSDSLSHIGSKFLMYLGLALGGFSYLDVKESLQFFCLLAGALAVMLSVILYVLRIYHMRISIKIISKQLKDDIKKEFNDKC